LLITYLVKLQPTAESEKKLINFGGKVIFLLALIFREAIQITGRVCHWGKRW